MEGDWKLSAVRKNKPIIYFVLGCITIVGIELFIFNYNYFIQKNLDSRKIDLSTIESEMAEYTHRGICVKAGSGYVEVAFPNINMDCESENIQIQLQGPDVITRCYIDVMDEGSAYNFQRANYVDIIPGSLRYGKGITNIYSHGKLKGIRIAFSNWTDKDIIIRGIIINAQRKLEINSVRLALMALILIIYIGIRNFGWNKIEYDWKNKKLTVGSFIPVILFILWLTIINGWANGQEAWKPLEYPFENNINKTIYEEQFEAFENGQLALLMEPDSRLEELKNPYDKSERSEKGVWYPWDHAYYNGKFYSYFGIAPILTVYYPFYWLTGKVPGINLCNYIIGIIGIVALYGMTRQVLKLFFSKINYMLFLLSYMAVVLCSQLFVYMVESNIYYLCYGSTVAFAGLAVTFGIMACEEQRNNIRRIYLVLSAVAVVFVVLSRPMGLLLVIAILMPLFLKMILKKDDSLKKKLITLAFFFLPVLVGAVFVCIYNALRFSSPFEFGNNYQLTESDISMNQLHIQNVGETLYYYFFNIPSFRTEFPWLHFGIIGDNTSGNYLFIIWNNYGVFSVPVVWAIFMVFFKKVNMPLMMRIIGCITVVASFFIAYFDFCMAGISSRYVGDILWFLVLLGVLLAVNFCGAGCQAHNNYRFTSLVFIVMIFSMFFGFLTVFNSESNIIFSKMPNVYLYFRDIVSL